MPTGVPAIQRTKWRRVALPVFGAVAVAAGALYGIYARDMRAAAERVTSGSALAETRYGQIEYTTWGEGPPVLTVHGAGGGYDQGLLPARAFGGTGFRWISPSRFGYLRSSLPGDASTAAQADAFADLLDALGVDRIAIVAMSGGVPPALQFAERHPERTSALVLLSSAPYTPLTAADQDLPLSAWLYQLLFSSDFPFWLLQKITPGSFESAFDVKPGMRAGLTPVEEAFVAGLIEAFPPVTQRLPGLANEGAAIDPGASYALADITAPTLIVHARDDGINPFPIGEFTAQHIPTAEFVPLPTGGHLLLGHHAELRARVNALLRQHTGAKPIAGPAETQGVRPDR
jgi:2-hydroxy-6-oxonona-2,4-dienedioate hydrolase